MWTTITMLMTIIGGTVGQDRFDKKMALVITMDMTMLTTMRIAMTMIREEDKTHTFSILFLRVISLFGPCKAQSLTTKNFLLNTPTGRSSTHQAALTTLNNIK